MAKMNSTIQNTFSTMTSGKENDQRYGVNNAVPQLLLLDYIRDYAADYAKRLLLDLCGEIFLPEANLHQDMRSQPPPEKKLRGLPASRMAEELAPPFETSTFPDE
jgi:hypothetical protein